MNHRLDGNAEQKVTPFSNHKELPSSHWGWNGRGVSWVFDEVAVQQVCLRFDLDLIVRAHQKVEDGYEFYANRRLVTVFSAPNYCGTFNNKGGILVVSKKLRCSVKTIAPGSGRWHDELQRPETGMADDDALTMWPGNEDPMARLAELEGLVEEEKVPKGTSGLNAAALAKLAVGASGAAGGKGAGGSTAKTGAADGGAATTAGAGTKVSAKQVLANPINPKTRKPWLRPEDVPAVPQLPACIKGNVARIVNSLLDDKSR